MNYEIISIETARKLAEYRKLKIEYQKLKLEHESLMRKLKKITGEKD